MPSPINRSSSFPDFSKLKSSLQSTQSTSSSCSSSTRRHKFLKKLRRNSKSCDLTEDSLSEHNRRQAVVVSADGKKHPTTSPYYKGLTDSQLYINRMRSAGLSPGRESHATRGSAASSISTFLFKLQGLGSACFKGKGQQNAAADVAGFDDPHSRPPYSSPRPTLPQMSYPPKLLDSRVSVSLMQSEIGDSLILKEVERRIETKPVEQKPLRERAWTAPTKGSNGSVQGLQKESTVEKFTWAKKYRPNALKDFICNRDKAEFLQNMASRGECSHLIFEGPPGVGKKTMIWAFLREAFGPKKLETTEELKEFKLKGEAVASIEVNVRISSKHVEINLSELRGHEKHVIVALIEESSITNTECDHDDCRVIVLYQADMLSTDAQHYIRWIMERHKGCSKILFCCSDISKLQPMRPICTHIPLLPPSKDEIVKVLEYIASQEGIELPHHLAERIAENSKQNLRQAIRSFEASWQLKNDFCKGDAHDGADLLSCLKLYAHDSYSFKEDQVILTGWEEDIANIAKNIVDEQSPKQLYIIRGKLQNLIEHDVSPDFIFRTLVGELKKHLDDHLQSKIDSLYVEYNRDNGSLLDGDKSLMLRYSQEELVKRNNDPSRKNVHHFMKIEEFTAKFMSFYKSSTKKNGGVDLL